MTLKFYTLLTMLFVLVLGNIVYFFITKESVALSVFDIHFASYPIAVWVAVPFVFYYLLHVTLMSFGSIQAYFRLRNYERDYEKLQDQIYNAYLQKDKLPDYKTPRYQKLGALVSNSVMTPKPNATIEDDKKLEDLYEVYKNLSKGKVVNLKKYSLEPSNPMMVKNAENALAEDNEQAERILSNATAYEKHFVQEAFGLYVEFATPSNILRYKSYLTLESFLKIVGRMTAEENPISFSIDDMIELIRVPELTEEDFTIIAKELKTILVPDQRIHLFENVSHDDEDAVRALLYTYTDLELLDNARELLDNYDETDYPIFRAYMELKKNNYGCSLDKLLGL